MKLHYVNNVKRTNAQFNNIQDSSKTTQILNMDEKNPNFKRKPSFKKWRNFAAHMDIALLNADKNNKTN